MPKIIQTGATITLSDLRVEEIKFSWQMEPVVPATDPATYAEVFHCHVTYSRVKDDGVTYDRVVREVTPGGAIITSLETYRTNQRTAQRTAEGI